MRKTDERDKRRIASSYLEDVDAIVRQLDSDRRTSTGVPRWS